MPCSSNQNIPKTPTKKTIGKHHRRRGVNDLLCYLIMLDDATVLHKDGAISRHYLYLAPDLDSSTANHLDLNSDTRANALGYLDDGWLLETNV